MKKTKPQVVWVVLDQSCHPSEILGVYTDKPKAFRAIEDVLDMASGKDISEYALESHEVE